MLYRAADSNEVDADLFTKQKQSDDGEDNAGYSLPGSCFVEKQNPRDGHDGGAAGQYRRHSRQRSAVLEKEKERDRTGADANSG